MPFAYIWLKGGMYKNGKYGLGNGGGHAAAPIQGEGTAITAWHVRKQRCGK